MNNHSPLSYRRVGHDVLGVGRSCREDGYVTPPPPPAAKKRIQVQDPGVYEDLRLTLLQALCVDLLKMEASTWRREEGPHLNTGRDCWVIRGLPISQDLPEGDSYGPASPLSGTPPPPCLLWHCGPHLNLSVSFASH